MRSVMCFGTFDIVHKGHIDYLRQAKQQGDMLIVVVAQDVTVRKFKKNLPFQTQEERMQAVKELNIADKVVRGYKDDYFQIIEEENPAVLCLGYDQNNSITQQLWSELQKRKLNTQIIRLSAYKPQIYKSSLLKKKRKVAYDHI